jgi:hypothetical protein
MSNFFLSSTSDHHIIIITNTIYRLGRTKEKERERERKKETEISGYNYIAKVKPMEI